MTIDRVEQLERLARLRAEDMLTAEEFAAEKAKILTDTRSGETAPVLDRRASGSSGLRNWLIALLVLLIGGGAVSVALVINDFPDGAPAPSPPVALSAPPVRSKAGVVQAKPPAPPPSQIGCKTRDCRILTPRGWAGIEAGMKVARAETASGLKLRDDGHYDGVEAPCRRYEVVGGPTDVSMLVEEGVITSLSAGGQAFRTDRGVRIGDPERAVRKAYKPLSQEPDPYGEAGDKMLYFNTERGKFGIVFGINKGKVSWITVGGSSRGYVEGCL